jgi:putative NIF3 family GTP cyclohydrolase 1 type 2
MSELVMTRISRRDFVRLGTAGAVAMPLVVDPTRARAAATTAQDIVARIRTALGVEWRADTTDTFKAGDPSTVVTGVVTTSLATIDVMRRAVKAGANMIITSGPTFYSRADRPTPPAGRGRGAAAASPAPADPVFAAKNEFITTHKLVVWRFSDHWRLRQPNPFTTGLIDALEWTRYRAADNPLTVTVPSIALDRLVEDVNRKLTARGGMRIVGNRQLRVRRIGFLPGSVPIQTTLDVLPQVDALIAGEIREWESSEYARDTVSEGLPRALILVGRTLSEDPGMKACAQWLETIVPDVRCRWMPVGDPYWRPA